MSHSFIILSPTRLLLLHLPLCHLIRSPSSPTVFPRTHLISNYIRFDATFLTLSPLHLSRLILPPFTTSIFFTYLRLCDIFCLLPLSNRHSLSASFSFFLSLSLSFLTATARRSSHRRPLYHSGTGHGSRSGKSQTLDLIFRL